MTVRIFAAPGRYVQGAGALAQLPALVAEFGKRPFILTDGAVTETQREEIERLLRPVTGRIIFAVCGEPDLDRYVESARALEADLVMALGGEPAQETAKRVRQALALPLMAVPTVPGCHAATSRLVLPEAEGEHPGPVAVMPRATELVLVDSAVLLQTPPRQFIAAMGDALARKFEVEQRRATRSRTLLDGLPTELALAAAEGCYRNLREHGQAALVSIVRRETGEPFERVVEALILLSGIAFESGGTWLAHALARGFGLLPGCRSVLHGERVAFALLAQLVYDGYRTEFITELVGFYRALGLPARLDEIGLVGDVAGTVQGVARRSCAGWLVPIDSKRLGEAILRADTLGRG